MAKKTISNVASDGPRVLPPPLPSDNARQALKTYAPARDDEGRIKRRTGRDVQFATIVTPEFKEWMKAEAKRRDKRMCVLLEDMRAAYEKVHGAKK
jgi:hypothetical protein